MKDAFLNVAAYNMEIRRLYIVIFRRKNLVKKRCSEISEFKESANDETNNVFYENSLHASMSRLKPLIVITEGNKYENGQQ